mgnify:CR=1 FL=1
MAKLFDAATVKASLADDRLKSLRQTYGKGKGKYEFQFVKTSQLSPGVYRIRFLPPFPGHAKRIPVRVVTHSVEIKMGKDPLRVICSGADCLICRLLLFMEPQVDGLSDPKKDALKIMNPWERYYFPLAVGAQPDPKDNNKYPQYVPDKSVEKGILLIVQADGIMTSILNLFTKYPDLSDIEEGRYLKLEKEGNNGYAFSEPGSPKPLGTPDLYTAEKYPKLDEMLFKNVKKMDGEDLLELLQGCWWSKIVNFDDLLEGGVGGDEPEEDEDEPAPVVKKKAKPVVEDDDEDIPEVEEEDDEPPVKRAGKKLAKAVADLGKSSAKKKPVDDDDEDDEKSPWDDDD